MNYESGSGDTLRARHQAAEYATARVLAEAGRLAEATPRILEAICTTLGWEHGALWQVDAHADRLRCVAAWHPPGASFTDFDAISRATSFERGVGLPGRVWASGQAAFIPDLLRDGELSSRVRGRQRGIARRLRFPDRHRRLRARRDGVLQ